MTGGNVTFKFLAITAGFVKGVKKAKNTIGLFSKGLNGMRRVVNRALGGLFKMHAHLISIYGLFRGFSAVFKQSFSAVENFNAFMAQTAAIITSFSGASLENIPKVFIASTAYAKDLRNEFLKINAQTLATVEQMQLVNRELNKGGVILKLNKKSMEGFADVTNAIAVLTAGMPDQARQFSQEMRSVMEGRARSGSTLALLLKGQLGKQWKEDVKEWIKAGTFIEKMGDTFAGFRQAAPMMSNMWQAVGSTLKSMSQEVLRIGFTDLFNEIIIKVKSLNKYLEDNRQQVSDLFKKVWKPFVDFLRAFDLSDVLKRMGSESIKGMAINLGMVLGEAMYNGLKKAVFAHAIKTGKSGVLAQLLFGSSDEEKAIFKRSNQFANILELEISAYERQKKRLAKAISISKSNRAIRTLDYLFRTTSNVEDETKKLAVQLSYMTETKAKIDALRDKMLGIDGAPSLAPAIPKPLNAKDKPSPGGGFDMPLENSLIKMRESLPILEQILNEMDSLFEEATESIQKNIKEGMTDALSSMMREANKMPEVWETVWQSLVKTVTDAIAKLIVEYLALAAVQLITGLLPSMPGVGTSGYLPGYKPSYGGGGSGETTFLPNVVSKGSSVIPSSFTSGINSNAVSSASNEGMMKKLDTLIEISAQNKYAIVDDSELSNLSKALNTTNYNLKYMGV